LNDIVWLAGLLGSSTILRVHYLIFDVTANVTERWVLKIAPESVDEFVCELGARS
jgi:hypothetical protein